MTRGRKSSEYKSLKTCFIANLCLVIYAIHEGVDLGGMVALIPAINSPIMFYAGARSYVKGKNGETD